jgi:predicted nuclease of restriction endonuclease-like (RecB) superfamily
MGILWQKDCLRTVETIGVVPFQALDSPIEDPLKREFYTETRRIKGWSTRTLDKKIQSVLFERTVLSRKLEKLAKKEIAE